MVALLFLWLSQSVWHLFFVHFQTKLRHKQATNVQYSMQTWGRAKVATFSTLGVRFPKRAEQMVLDYSKAMNLLKFPVGEKWYTSELKAHRSVLHHTTFGVNTAMFWPEFVARNEFHETTFTLIGELHRCSIGVGHLLIHTDGCCSEF